MAKQIKYDRVDNIITNQIVRAATAIGANYRSALRGRSIKDFISRITIAGEEADETCYWLEILIDMEVFPKSKLEPLLKEAWELTAIMVASGKTAKSKITQ